MSSEILRYITQHGYTAIFILIFLQEIGVPNPFPNELVLLFSGYLTYKGALLLPVVLLSAISADTIGATILYFTFYFFGTYILSHKPKWLPISVKKINQLTGKISTGGLWSVFLGRLTPFIRGYVSVISGLLQIKPKLYLPIILLTAILVSSAYVIAGRLLGPYWSEVDVAKIKYYILAIIILVIILAIIRHYHKKQKNTVADH